MKRHHLILLLALTGLWGCPPKETHDGHSHDKKQGAKHSDHDGHKHEPAKQHQDKDGHESEPKEPHKHHDGHNHEKDEPKKQSKEGQDDSPVEQSQTTLKRIKIQTQKAKKRVLSNVLSATDRVDFNQDRFAYGTLQASLVPSRPSADRVSIDVQQHLSWAQANGPRTAHPLTQSGGPPMVEGGRS